MKTLEWSLLILILLKLVGFLDASWWLVLVPAYIGIVIGFVPAFVAGFKKRRIKMNEINMQYEFKQGWALVITGAQGCGKTTLARKIAEQHGAFLETENWNFESNFGLGTLISKNPATIICEGIPFAADLDKLVGIIASEKIKVSLQHRDDEFFKTPNFIFCTNSPPPPTLTNELCFTIVTLIGQD